MCGSGLSAVMTAGFIDIPQVYASSVGKLNETLYNLPTLFTRNGGGGHGE